MSYPSFKVLQILNYSHHILFLKFLREVCFVSRRPSTGHPYKRPMFKLRFKERLKEHLSLLKYYIKSKFTSTKST